jgi:hypothetical protein
MRSLHLPEISIGDEELTMKVEKTKALFEEVVDSFLDEPIEEKTIKYENKTTDTVR